MKLQSLIIVMLRLMALNYLLQIAVQLTPQLLRFVPIYAEMLRDDSLSLFALPWLALVGSARAAVFLWFCSVPIARFVTRGVSQELSVGPLSLVDCYSIAFIAVGLFYVAGNLSQVLNWAHYSFKIAASGRTGNQEAINGYVISQAFVPFTAGLVLFVNGRRWAFSLARRQVQREAADTKGESETLP